MMDITFAIPRHRYDSYEDWRSLARLSGFPIVYFDQIDLGQRTAYVCTPINGEFRPLMAEKRKAHPNGPGRVIWWNLERLSHSDLKPMDPPGWWGVHSGFDSLEGYCDECWCSDQWFLGMIKNGIPDKYTRWRWVPMASHAQLGSWTLNHPKMYQFCHMSYVNGRRAPIIDNLSKLFTCAPGAMPPERDLVLKHTQVMVNIHQDDLPMSEPLRFALAAAYAMPVISEPMVDPSPLVAGVDFLNVPLPEIPNQLDRLLKDPGRMAELGNSLRIKLTRDDANFQTVVYKAVETAERERQW